MVTLNIYEQIGPARVEQVITEFYRRAFSDVMIGHFFFHHDRETITKGQIAFATAMLGGPRLYKGRALEALHHPLPIRPPHFARRQVLMREVLVDVGVEESLAKAWLAMEERLKPLIIRSIASCRS